MLGVDAVDAMLFGGNDEGLEATFNDPNKVNGRYRPYDRAFDPAKLTAARKKADGSSRAHSKFTEPPVRLSKLPTWAAVTWHCREADDWAAAFRAAVPDARTKFFIHSYERCGVADKKRGMRDMLYEGINHLDRIPFGAHSSNVSAFAHHIVQHYAKLPDRLLFVKGGFAAAQLGPQEAARAWLEKEGSGAGTIVDASAASAARDVPLAAGLCDTYKAVTGAADCPSTASVDGSWSGLVVSRSAVLAVPKERWQAALAALSKASVDDIGRHEELMLGLLPALLGVSKSSPNVFGGAAAAP